jgi:diaminohydroxyphosphoribosylaminopyrimidine deaminase/5-amino-6-(5-phosphoribosylamino)uracil reductase
MMEHAGAAARPHDAEFMSAAIALARRNIGQTWPNPAVGCVLVAEQPDGCRVVGRGWTASGGRPHAETEALLQAGPNARGTTAYVSLEPCAHHAQTAPCAQALIGAGIGRAVIATEDPDPRVRGRGIAMLEAAGIPVSVGPGRAAAEELNRGFLKRFSHSLPLVTLKLASTLDGRIATANHESRWITGERARREVHALRAEYDAILVGSSTVLEDDPELTCRLPGLAARSPIRIIADSRMRVSLTSRLTQSAREVPTWILTLPTIEVQRRRALVDLGLDVIEVAPGSDGHIDLKLALELIAARGITRVLAEGGAALAASLLLADLVDRLVWFRAPSLIGATGLPAIAGLGVESLGAQPRFKRVGTRAVGEDQMETYSRVASA